MNTHFAPHDLFLHVHREIKINAPSSIVFDSILDQIGHGNHMPDGSPFPMQIEPWPGGRWFRDLGPGVGHLWGHVQVIKPPTLLEIHGPLFMSYAAISHVQYRVTARDDASLLSITHRAMGQILAEHKEGVQMGWQSLLDAIAEAALARAASPARPR